MKCALRLGLALCVIASITLPTWAGLDSSFDWPNDPATGKPRRKLRIKNNAPADTKLGDKPLKDVVKEAVDNWNSVKGDTGWEFEIVTTDPADVVVGADDNLNINGGARTSYRVDANGRVDGQAKITFDPSPPNYSWDQAGKPKDDTKNPVSCAMHELSHLLRLDHQGGKRSASSKIKDPQGSDTKGDDVTAVSQDDKDEAKKTSTLAIEKAVEGQPVGHDGDLKVACFAGETPAYPVPPSIRLWCPGGVFLSPVEVSLQRRSVNSLPDPDLLVSFSHGRLIKGLEVVLKGLPGLPPRIAPGSQFTVEIPYEDGLAGYDHLFEGRDPDYGDAEELGLHPLIWDPRTETWLDVDLSVIGGGMWLDPAGNVLTAALPTQLMNAFATGDGSETRLLIALATKPALFGDAMMVVPDPMRCGTPGTVILNLATPAPPGGLLVLVESTDPLVLAPGYVLVAEGLTRAEAPFATLARPAPERPQMLASGPFYDVDSFFDIFIEMSVTPHPSTAPIGTVARLEAHLMTTIEGAAVAGQPVLFAVDGEPAAVAFTDPGGRAAMDYIVPEREGAGPRVWSATFLGDMPRYASASGQAMLQATPGTSVLSVPDRTGTITEPVTLRAYLMRVPDNAWLNGRIVDFSVDGTLVGSAVTGGSGTSGRADLTWIIAPGAPSRTISAAFAGDAAYLASAAVGQLTCLTWATKMVPFGRTARITDRTELKARLLRSDNAPIYGRAVNMYVEGTFVVARPTDVSGYAKWPVYEVPDGAGAGDRSLLYEWPGDGGYQAISREATLTVLKAIPYIWVLSKSAPQGSTISLYSYFRRLYDYQKQGGKTVVWSIDGTDIHTMDTDANGVASFVYKTTQGAGVHTMRVDFAGDPWVDEGSGQATLTLY